MARKGKSTRRRGGRSSGGVQVLKSASFVGPSSRSSNMSSQGSRQTPPANDDEAQLQDYQQLLHDLLSLPGREHLIILSPHRIPDRESFWFGCDKGKLSRVIAGIFRRKFDGPYFSWKVTPLKIKERYFRAFARKYNWDLGITELVKEGFLKIAKKQMKGIVSQAKRSSQKPGWIGDTLWREMWVHWNTLDEDDAENSANSTQQSSTHRTLTLEEQNEIFLKVNERKVMRASILELDDQLRRKVDELDAANARRNAERREIARLEMVIVSYMKQKDSAFAAFIATQQPLLATTTPNTAPANNTTAITLTAGTSPETAPRTTPVTMEMVFSYMKENDPAFAAFVATQQPPPATTTPANETTAVTLTAQGTSPKTAPRTTPATASTNLPLSNTSSSTSPAS